MRNKKRVLSGLLSFLIATTMAGCAEKMECNEDEAHIHRHFNSLGYINYMNNHYSYYGDFQWTEDYKMISEEDIKLYDFLKLHSLISIEENYDLLCDVVENNINKIEYEYLQEERILDYYINSFGFRTKEATETITNSEGKQEVNANYPVYKTVNIQHFSDDPNVKNRTGRYHELNATYHAFKVILNEAGEYEEIRSGDTDDIMNVATDYPYFKLNDYCEVTPSQELQVKDDSLTLTK